MRTLKCQRSATFPAGRVLADFGEGSHHVEFGGPEIPVVLSPSDFQYWLEQYDFVHELAFSEVPRADGTRLIAQLFADDSPPNDLHTISEWPIDDAKTD